MIIVPEIVIVVVVFVSLEVFGVVVTSEILIVVAVVMGFVVTVLMFGRIFDYTSKLR